MGVGVRRLFWIGAAALLAAAALIAIVALVRGELTDTDGKILFTLTLAAGSVCLAGLALIDRRDFPTLGWAAVATGIAAFVVIARAIWTNVHNDELLVTALLLLGVLLLATTGRLLPRRPALEPLYAAHLVLSVFATTGTIWLIWDEGNSPDSWGKLLGAVWILAGLAWFLVPVLTRTAARSSAPADRIVGRGPGRIEVELGEGETLVVRSG